MKKLTPWTLEDCKIKKEDKIHLIDRPSHFIVKDIRKDGIASLELDHITWEDLMLHFVTEDNQRCGKYI